MNIYMARQPILDRYNKTFAYELLYRVGLKNAYDPSTDGNFASASVVSDAITAFGVSNITNGTSAFINFTRDLIINEFAYFFNPKEVTVEILEDVKIDNLMIEKIKQLYADGYTIALDDYIGDERFDPIMQYIHIIKVDFMLTDFAARKSLVEKYKKMGITMLAEKVETQQDYQQAFDLGYDLFQGYYFAKPSIETTKHLKVSSHSYIPILVELQSDEPDVYSLAENIQLDVNLTYKLLRLVNSVYYYRGNQVASVKNAVLLLGLTEIKKWMMLIMIRDLNKNKPDELVKLTLLRARLAEQIAVAVDIPQYKEDAFFVGMFSLIDAIVGNEIGDVLSELPLSQTVKDTLTSKDTPITNILLLIEAYEQPDWDAVLSISSKLNIEQEKMIALYLEALSYSHVVFESA